MITTGTVLLVVYLILAIVIGAAANARGRSAIIWFLMALLLTPVLAVLLLIAFPQASADMVHAPVPAVRGAS
jgi:hypothetical protein